MSGGHMLRVGLAGGATLVVGAVLAASASAAVLFNQVPNGSFQVGTYPSFAGGPADTNQVADDFRVPRGEVWRPRSAETFGVADLGTGDAVGNVWIYAGGGDVPGAELLSRQSVTLANGSCAPSANCNPRFEIPNAPRLKPGEYWLSLQVNGAYAWRWAVTPPDLSSGRPAVWQNPGDGSSTGCTTWTPLIDCDSFISPDDGRDMIFRLNGDLIDSRFTINDVDSVGLRVFLIVTFPDPGMAKVKGKKLRAASKKVRSGTSKLPLRLKRGAKRKLSGGKRVTLKPSVTFTAKGGVPFTQKARVVLIPARAAAGAPAVRLAD